MTEFVHESQSEGTEPEMQDQETIEQIAQRAERIRDRELETALAKLEELDDRERAIVERLAARLTERLLAPPARGLERGAARDDDDAAAVARDLFGDE
jgi:glutamyl-tRNA reductase